jgi:hypothetical protein
MLYLRIKSQLLHSLSKTSCGKTDIRTSVGSLHLSFSTICALTNDEQSRNRPILIGWILARPGNGADLHYCCEEWSNNCV